MQWYHYLAAFWGGAFAANTIPHLVKGIAGDPFPTPFANPPGKGLSSPAVNVAWALFNLLIAFVLFRAGMISTANTPALITWFAGFSFLGLLMSRHFSTKHKAQIN